MISDRPKLIVFFTLLTGFLAYSFVLYLNPVKVKDHDSLADRGKMVWQQQNCGACHQVYGLGGYLGPDLTNAYSLRGPEYIRAFVKSGTETMPSFHLTGEDMHALLEYLKDVDASGKADPRTFTINKNGTIRQ